ncbi:hypothetical protein Tco_0582946, partial [Tanacetum coccineum]
KVEIKTGETTPQVVSSHEDSTDQEAAPTSVARDDPIACLNKAMAFLTAVASSRGDKENVILVLVIRIMLLVLGETIQVDRQRLLNATTVKTKDLDTYDSDYDDISNAKTVPMANISNYGSDVILEEKANKEQNNESVTAELERYKERVKTFEQRLNIDLSSREKMIDSQMDDMIKEKLALKEQVDSLEQNLSKQIKEKEDLREASSDIEKELYEESSDQEEFYDEDSSDLEEYLGMFDESDQEEDLGEDDSDQDDSDDGWV